MFELFAKKITFDTPMLSDVFTSTFTVPPTTEPFEGEIKKPEGGVLSIFMFLVPDEPTFPARSFALTSIV